MRFRTNKILEKNRQGKKGIGCGLVYPSAEAIENVGMLGGFDFVQLGERGREHLVCVEQCVISHTWRPIFQLTRILSSVRSKSAASGRKRRLLPGRFRNSSCVVNKDVFSNCLPSSSGIRNTTTRLHARVSEHVCRHQRLVPGHATGHSAQRAGGGSAV